MNKIRIARKANKVLKKSAGILCFSILTILHFSACTPRERAQVPVREPGQEPVLPAEQARDRAPGSVITREEAGEFIFYIREDGIFELPVVGSTGWAAIEMPLYNSADENAYIITLLEAGQGFTILEEAAGWWRVAVNNISGWVRNELCMINLPDIIPSIVHNNTNTTFSLFRSSGREIPNVTGMALYQARDFNVRLGRYEYIAAVLYGMARKIGAAQQAALANGHTLVIYEAFRPAEAHNRVYENLHALAAADPAVWAGISTPPWNSRWFLAASPYNHQRGTAIDVSLARIDSYEFRVTGDFAFIHISGYTEYQMQTPMHELSIDAVVFTGPVHSRSLTAWRDGVFSERATIGTRLMHRYLTDAGLIPLASEWWHFNDLVNTALAVEANITGEFSTERTFSRPPRAVR